MAVVEAGQSCFLADERFLSLQCEHAQSVKCVLRAVWRITQLGLSAPAFHASALFVYFLGTRLCICCPSLNCLANAFDLVNHHCETSQFHKQVHNTKGVVTN